MTVSIAPKRAISALFGAAIVGSALLAAAPASALTATYDLDLDPVAPVSGTYVSGQEVEVSGNGIPDGEYFLSFCEANAYLTNPFGSPSTVEIPACGNDTKVDVTVVGGSFVETIEMVVSEDNAHYFLSATQQPAQIDLSERKGQVVLAPAHGGGLSGSLTAVSDQFNVN